MFLRFICVTLALCSVHIPLVLASQDEGMGYFIADDFLKEGEDAFGEFVKPDNREEANVRIKNAPILTFLKLDSTVFWRMLFKNAEEIWKSLKYCKKTELEALLFHFNKSMASYKQNAKLDNERADKLRNKTKLLKELEDMVSERSELEKNHQPPPDTVGDTFSGNIRPVLESMKRIQDKIKKEAGSSGATTPPGSSSPVRSENSPSADQTQPTSTVVAAAATDRAAPADPAPASPAPPGPVSVVPTANAAAVAALIGNSGPLAPQLPAALDQPQDYAALQASVPGYQPAPLMRQANPPQLPAVGQAYVPAQPGYAAPQPAYVPAQPTYAAPQPAYVLAQPAYAAPQPAYVGAVPGPQQQGYYYTE